MNLWNYERGLPLLAKYLSETKEKIARLQRNIDERCFDLYDLSEKDRNSIVRGFGEPDCAEGVTPADDAKKVDFEELSSSLLSWCIGVSFRPIRCETSDITSRTSR